MYLRVMEMGSVTITAKVLYTIGDDQFSQSVDLKLPIIEPFSVSFRFLSLKVCTSI